MAKAQDRVERQRARRAARRDANRAEILDAAERVFAREGIRTATIRSIAAEAGFSPGAVYLFFENRQHLAAEAITRRGDELNALLHSTVAAAPDPLSALHSVVDVTLQFFAKRDHFRQMLRELRGDLRMMGPVLSEYASEVDQRLRFAQDLLAGVVSEAQAAGTIRVDNPHVLAHLYMVLVNEIVHLRAQPEMELSNDSFHAIIDGALGTRSRPG